MSIVDSQDWSSRDEASAVAEDSAGICSRVTHLAGRNVESQDQAEDREQYHEADTKPRGCDDHENHGRCESKDTQGEGKHTHREETAVSAEPPSSPTNQQPECLRGEHLPLEVVAYLGKND